MTITKDMSIMEVVQKYPDTVEVFMNSGMGCLGCAAAHFENIEQGFVGLDRKLAAARLDSDLIAHGFLLFPYRLG